MNRLRAFLERWADGGPGLGDVLIEKAPRLVAGVLVVVLIGRTLTAADSSKAIITGVVITTITALGLDVLVARTGQLSLAHAAFLGVGTIAAINLGGSDVPWPAAVIGAMIVTAALAALCGVPSLRIRGLQIAITTLAFQVMVESTIFPDPDLNASTKFFERPSFLRTESSMFLFSVAALAVVLVARHRLAVTRAGRAFLAVRDVEDRAQTWAVEPGPSKLLSYALSGAIVGLGGATFGMQQQNLGSAFGDFSLLESLQLVAITVVGGAGSAAGIAVAAFVMKGVPRLVESDLVGRFTPMLSAALLVAAVVFVPRGIGGLLADLEQWFLKLVGRVPEPPDPRPRFVEVTDAARRAAHLREVPRGLGVRVPTPALLVARDATVQYGGVVALNHVDLEVRRGEIVGLIGANGAGKSTFFNAASGLAPTSGSIRFRGTELVGASPSVRTRLGLARTFQDMGLVRAETVRENVLLAQTWLARYPAAAGILALGSTVATERELRRRADLALELFGLDHLADERLGDLPYGTMRIAEIASAVATGPDLLLLDEATAGLGPEEAQALGDRFLTLRADLGLTLVVIEHHVPLIRRVCDYCYCLESGTLIAEGDPDHVVAQPQVVESFLGRSAAASGGGE